HPKGCKTTIATLGTVAIRVTRNDTVDAMSDGAVVRAVGRWLGRQVELSRLISDAVAAVAAAIGAERGTFFLREPGTGHLVAVAGHFPELPEIRLAPGQGIAGHVVATGETLVLPDVAADPRF